MASAFLSQPVPDRWSAQLTSTFQRRQVARDLAKTLPETLKTAEYDRLLIDSIDERFRLFRLRAGGRLVTLSAEFQRTWMSRPEPGQIVAPEAPERFDLWRRGWDRMIDGLAQRGHLDRVVVNCVFWATTGLPEFDEKRDGANADLQRMYDHCATSLPENQFLRYDPALMVANTEHKWGLAPFHYSAPLYYETLRQLKAL